MFRAYYDTKTSHRKLTWNYTLGQATVKGNYAISYDLQVTTLQALTLLVFNRHAVNVSPCFPLGAPFTAVSSATCAVSQVSFEELRAALNVEEEIMKRLLHSLSCGKYVVLTKEPAGRTINTSDKFSFNETFSCPLRKIRIPMASLDDTHNPQRVEEDRSIAIEAAIVRLLTTAAVLVLASPNSCAGPHDEDSQNLAAPSAHHGSHPATPLFQTQPQGAGACVGVRCAHLVVLLGSQIIKRRIEHLIEREYIERDTADTNLYRYLA